MIKIKSSNYTFYLDGRNIYIRIGLNQCFFLQTLDYRQLTSYDYIRIIDTIYKRKITDTTSFNDNIYSKFRLTATTRKLK